MPDIKNKGKHIGIVKWFGGYNRHKEKNDFGFIQTINNNDVFIHKNEIQTGDDLDKDELVIFEVCEKKGKLSSKNLFNIKGENKNILLEDIFNIYLETRVDKSKPINSDFLDDAIVKIIDESFSTRNLGFISFLKKEAVVNFDVFRIIKQSQKWPENFNYIVDDENLCLILKRQHLLDYVPPGYIKEHESLFNRCVQELSDSERSEIFNNYISILPINIVLVCVINKTLTNERLIKCRYDELNQIIKRKFREEGDSLPEYVNEAFNSSFQDKNDYLSNPTIWRIVEPFLFKKYLYNKNNNISVFFNESKHLTNNIEYFILAKLFPLILMNNSLDVTYKIFLHHLWESMESEKIDIHDEGLFNLFPSCGTIGDNLSCEAVFWPKTKAYLCRGKKCNLPRVRADINKHYLDFNIYDWFQHYGINYISEGQPSKKDFPIKIAGYINRLKEIFSVLHCKQCNKLMKPDMKYARVEYIDYSSGEPVKRSMSAAYRATVFECGDHKCIEHGNKCYINHCVGFGCGSIIDSRDLKIKCDAGLYVCKGCGGCCERHAKNNPVGICPDCGDNLSLYEYNDKNRYGYSERFVKCNNQSCSFEIMKNLPKKFTLQSCLPVKKVYR